MTCFACEKLFSQCSVEDYMKPCFKKLMLMIRHTVGEICDRSGPKVIRVKLSGNFRLIFPIAA